MVICAMSNKFPKELKGQFDSANTRSKSNASKNNKNSLLEAVVGSVNVKRWNAIKDLFSCETNENFATKLLNLAQETINNRTSLKEAKEATAPKRRKVKKNEKTKRKAATRSNEEIKKKGTDVNSLPTNSQKTVTKPVITKTVENVRAEPSTDSILKKSLQSKKAQPIKNSVPPDNVEINVTEHKFTKNAEITRPVKSNKPIEIIKNNIKAPPEPQHPTDNKLEEIKPNNGTFSTDPATKTKCQKCNIRHNQDSCPINSPKCFIPDSLSIDEWREHYETDYTKYCTDNESEFRNENAEEISFARMSLPTVLQFQDSTSDHGLGVWARSDITEFTQFGPLMGKIVKEVDIPEDSTMQDLWEMASDNSNTYINTEDLRTSNWLKYIRPASTSDKRNITVVVRENSLVFITTSPIKAGEELLYWQDHSISTNKKKLEKTVCGGCNMTFAHPLYYRIHCSVFHDVRYSLTIRKYHCKVCGVAVLGKENIMKHAAELHNGQGAYQCQFCKKFFLRLNYLEMHRTYGCSANPHRSRPLCDFCGRKFCQPQKLKVHIKRMHSDFSEVLKEFQCKNCLKILGSRAALQRHLKEVHKKFTDGTCSCSRCGKHFQNKSNLKIHMLTHSGIKPFRCIVKNCNAAFTTKQCLQFHYKKVHNYDENKMPKIERSVDYTFEAYSGMEDADNNKKNEDANLQNSESNPDILNDDSDVEEQDMNKIPDNPISTQSPPLQEIEDDPPNTTSVLEPYRPNSINSVAKILSKGSKKWIADQEVDTIRSEIYQLEHKIYKDDLSNVSLHLQDPQSYSRPKIVSNLPDLARHDASNASLLVEAALDSVCSESNNVDIDVSSTPNCTDALVSNLYTLAPTDTLTDVTYNETVDMNEPRDINLISPSVNDHISVTDDLHDDLGQNQSIGLDYSGFHHEEFGSNNLGLSHKNSFVKNYINSLSPQNHNYHDKPRSPACSPPRYDFNQPINTDHLSSDESDGMTAQNLSIHSKHNIQLDLSPYKPTYKFDAPFQSKRTKYVDEIEKNVVYNDEEESKGYADEENNTVDSEHLDTINQNELSSKITDIELKENEDCHRTKYPNELSHEIKAKLDLDLDVRIKSYDANADNLRPSRILYDSDLDFRNKCYDLIDTVESRNKSLYDSVESEFRPERNFEPLVLNSSELQGLDMSARTFQNYSTMNRYHHLYPEVDRVDLRLNYSPPPPSYTHSDILRVVSLDLTPPGRHGVELSLRNHPLHQITNSRLLTDHTLQPNSPHRLLDQSRLLGSDLSTRHLTGLSDTGTRMLSDHTTNRILSNTDQLPNLLATDQRLIGEDSRILSDQSRLLDGRILPPATPNGSVSPVPAFTGYSVSQSPYHPTLATRQHVSSSTPTPFHHYSTYY